MEAYKFKTKVSENGTISVPEGFDVKNKEVEVIILVQTEQNIAQERSSEISQ
ncbi:hypothetical protein GCM10022289_35990 [Pedobacter jeongneungensis]|uniref:Uncharacterized protein n=1 Tax=Pedobacter jeongneungensis TaxID=947309 RepID=A0ABP8BM95_9SPHI|nr:hypothetical protein [Pedobacter miscanthi]